MDRESGIVVECSQNMTIITPVFERELIPNGSKRVPKGTGFANELHPLPSSFSVFFSSFSSLPSLTCAF